MAEKQQNRSMRNESFPEDIDLLGRFVKIFCTNARSKEGNKSYFQTNSFEYTHSNLKKSTDMAGNNLLFDRLYLPDFHSNIVLKKLRLTHHFRFKSKPFKGSKHQGG